MKGNSWNVQLIAKKKKKSEISGLPASLHVPVNLIIRVEVKIVRYMGV